MLTTKTRTPDEVARLGTEIIDRDIASSLGDSDAGRFLAVDVNTGEYEIDDDDYTAVRRLRDRVSEADVWLSCVGEEASDQMGLR